MVYYVSIYNSKKRRALKRQRSLNRNKSRLNAKVIANYGRNWETDSDSSDSDSSDSSTDISDTSDPDQDAHDPFNGNYIELLTGDSRDMSIGNNTLSEYMHYHNRNVPPCAPKYILEHFSHSSLFHEILVSHRYGDASFGEGIPYMKMIKVLDVYGNVFKTDRLNRILRYDAEGIPRGWCHFGFPYILYGKYQVWIQARKFGLYMFVKNWAGSHCEWAPIRIYESMGNITGVKVFTHIEYHRNRIWNTLEQMKDRFP